MSGARRTVLWVVDEGAVDVQCYLVLVAIRGQVLPRASIILFAGAAKQQGPYNESTWPVKATCGRRRTGCATQTVADEAVDARREPHQLAEVA
jgi:hypothetical protein